MYAPKHDVSLLSVTSVAHSHALWNPIWLLKPKQNAELENRKHRRVSCSGFLSFMEHQISGNVAFMFMMALVRGDKDSQKAEACIYFFSLIPWIAQYALALRYWRECIHENMIWRHG